MQGHPGGAEHTRYLIELAFAEPNSRWLDLGAGDGSTVEILKELGHAAEGIDLQPRGDGVRQGDFLRMDYGDGQFDAAISQCAFYSSGDIAGALKEAGRVLRKGGKLVFSDVCADVVRLLNDARAAGFVVRHMEDLTEQWKEYYLEALWREEDVPKGKGLAYVLFVCERM